MSETTTTVQQGGLSTGQLVFLCAASGIPAVGLSSFAVLLVGSAQWGSWLAALITAVIGFALGRVIVVFARRYVASGSLASYVAEIFGERARAFVGAALLLGYLGQLIAIQVLAATYATSFLASVGVSQASSPQVLVPIFVVTGIVPAAVAWRGLNESVRLAVVFTVISIPLILFISGASAWHTGLDLGRQFSLEGSTFSGVAIGLGAAASWLVSFESGLTLASETKNPKKALPIAVFAIPTVVVGYFLATFLQIPGLMQVGDKVAAGESVPAALAELAGLGTWVGQACDLVLCVGVFAALIGFTNYLSRIMVDYAEDGMLPAAFSRRDLNRGTPVVAIMAAVGLSTVILVGVVLVSANSLLTVYTAVATVLVYFWILPYVLICAAAVVLMLRERVFRISVAVCAIIGIVGMSWPWINSFIEPPTSPVNLMSYVAVAAVLALGLLFLAMRRRSGVRRNESTDKLPVS